MYQHGQISKNNAVLKGKLQNYICLCVIVYYIGVCIYLYLCMDIDVDNVDINLKGKYISSSE